MSVNLISHLFHTSESRKSVPTEKVTGTSIYKLYTMYMVPQCISTNITAFALSGPGFNVGKYLKF